MIDSRRISNILLLLFLVSSFDHAIAQSSPQSNATIDQIAIDTLNKNRLKFITITGASTYTIGSVGLYFSWYKDYPTSSFHFFNDFDEWHNVDKLGHTFSAYSQTDLIYKGFKWAGLNDDQSLLWSSASATLFQSTIEIMDGFSRQWGFSWTDFGANLMGSGLYVAQQKVWKEQKIRLKFSSHINSYEFANDLRGQNIDLHSRANDLFGSGLESILKDYNAQTIWLSGNLNALFNTDRFPDWMNISVGYGAQNLYGGFDNVWFEDDGQKVDLRNQERYGQFYLSLDADLSKIHTSSKFFRTLLDVLNVLKMPFSALEINTLGELKFKIIHF